MSDEEYLSPTDLQEIDGKNWKRATLLKYLNHYKEGAPPFGPNDNVSKLQASFAQLQRNLLGGKKSKAPAASPNNNKKKELKRAYWDLKRDLEKAEEEYNEALEQLQEAKDELSAKSGDLEKTKKLLKGQEAEVSTAKESLDERKAALSSIEAAKFKLQDRAQKAKDDYLRFKRQDSVSEESSRERSPVRDRKKKK